MRYLTIIFITSAVAAVTYIFLALLLAPAPIKAEYWVREMIVVKRNIAQKYRGQPKIIVAAGSNVLFGIDTKQLSDELEIPVINFGLNRGLSLKTILDEFGAAVEKNDTLILALEPSYYSKDELGKWRARNSIAWDRGEWESMPLLDKIKSIYVLAPSILLELAEARLEEVLLPKSIENRLRALDDQAILSKFASAPKPLTFAYSAYNLDSLGNLQKIDGSQFNGNIDSAEEMIKICHESRQLLHSFISTMAAKDVAVYFANTPYVETNNMNPEKVWDAFMYITNQLAPLAPVLENESPLILNKRFFFDNDLHLNAEGKNLRTKMLATAIQRNKTFMVRIQKQRLFSKRKNSF